MNAKKHDGNNSAFTLMWMLTGLVVSVLRGFCAESTAGTTFETAPAVATSFVLVTNAIVVTNYVVTTNVVLKTKLPVTGPHVPTFQRLKTSTPVLPDLSWVPPEDGFDWIQLNTGEWLKGRLKALQDRQVEFFSEKLSDVTFDWKDIRQVRSPRTIDILFVDGRKVSGSITVTPAQVTVEGKEPCVVPREQLQSLTPGGAQERDYWSVDLVTGLTLQAGNTKSAQYNAQVDLQRRTPATRLSLNYIGNFSTVNGTESANNHRVNTEFDSWLSQRFYLILPSAEYYQDPFQNLAHRLTLGGGIGYDLIDRPKLEWNITTGPAYQEAWFDSSQPGEPTDKGTAALTFGSRFKWDITRHVKWLIQYRGQYTSREVGETTHHAISTLSVDLNKRLTLDVSGIWDRISEPKVGADGIKPKPDDFSLVVGLGVHF